MGSGFNRLELGDSPAATPAGLLETHVQTQQKLEIMLRYWEDWALIIAQATGHAFCVKFSSLVDGFAGAGLHATNSHPDGAVAGTPVQAFHAAVNIKRRYPGVDVHLRAVDVDKSIAQELERRLMKAPGTADEKPKWRVYADPFQKAYPKIIEEMRADIVHTHSSGPTYRLHDHRSLWLIDPFGVKDIPHADLEPLQNLPGAEVIINLDLGGLLRIKGAAEIALVEGDPDAFQANIKAGNAKRLDLTWGSEYWRDDLAKADTNDILRSLAQSYADTFHRFEFRSVYPLRGSRSQRRYLVHLTHVEVAMTRFKGICDGCFLIDTLFARDLSQNQRAVRAVQLWERFKGTTTTVPELYELGMGASRTQIAAICRSAQSGGYGDFDGQRSTMTWRREREPDPVMFPDLG
jgi:three-Cys-motif partner protein